MKNWSFDKFNEYELYRNINTVPHRGVGDSIKKLHINVV